MRTTCSGPFDPSDSGRARKAFAGIPGLPQSRWWLLRRWLSAGTSWGADISEIYAEAVANDPVLARARASYEISKTGVTIARANLLPQVSASAGRSTSTTSVDSIDMNPSSPNFGRPTPDTESPQARAGARTSPSRC